MNSRTNEADVIVIGAGIIGAATALGLARKGRKVICLDKLPAAGYGSTSGSCAIIRPYYSTVDGSALAYESHYYWRDWSAFVGTEDERGLAAYNDCGCLVLKTPQNGQLKNVSAIMDKIGAPYEHLSVEQVREKLPFVCLDSFAPAKMPDDPEFGLANEDALIGGVFFPSGGYISDPQLATHNLQRAGEALSVNYLFNAEVQVIEQQNGRVEGVVLADKTRLCAPVIVNVAGPHSYKINALAGIEQAMNIKTRALRHEVSHVPSPGGVDVEDTGCVFSDSDIATYFRPEKGNYLLLGSEDPECDERQWVDPDDFNPNFTEQWRTQVLRMAQRIPDLAVPNRAKGVVELYDVSDDWIPIYDRSDLAGYYMAIGTSGNQFKNAPVVGEMMADLVQACESGHDHDTDPVRFRLRHIDREVSLGFYSRNREINRDSSFSVLG